MEDVFSFDAFMSKDGSKKPATKPIKDSFLKEVNEEELIKESQNIDQMNEYDSESIDSEEESSIEDSFEDNFEEESLEESAFKVEEDDSYYKLYQDKNEEFVCDIHVEGSSPEDTYARIIVESENWSLMFPGEIKNGKCIVPIRKLNILKEGEVGNIKLEVVAEGNLFIPWENQFKVKLSKKVTVNVNESKKNNIKKPKMPGKIDVKVKI